MTTRTTTANPVSPLTNVFAGVADEEGAGTTSYVTLKLRNAGLSPEESCETMVLGEEEVLTIPDLKVLRVPGYQGPDSIQAEDHVKGRKYLFLNDRRKGRFNDSSPSTVKWINWERGFSKHITSNSSTVYTGRIERPYVSPLSTCNHFYPNEKSLQFTFKVDCHGSIGGQRWCWINRDKTVKIEYVGLTFGNKRFQWNQGHWFKDPFNYDGFPDRSGNPWFDIPCSNCEIK